MQKIIKVTLLLILFQQAVCYAQTDSLVLVRLSRVNYCNGKVYEAKILNDRVLVKEGQIINLNQQISKKQEEIDSYLTDIDVFKKQLLNRNSGLEIYKQQDLHQKTEIKQLRKKNVVLKIGLVVISGIAGYSIINSN
jgi:hypothetical protein